MGDTGIEPATSCVSSRRSNQSELIARFLILTVPLRTRGRHVRLVTIAHERPESYSTSIIFFICLGCGLFVKNHNNRYLLIALAYAIYFSLLFEAEGYAGTFRDEAHCLAYVRA